MTLVWGKTCLVYKGQASEALTGLLWIKFNNKNHKSPLGSNKSDLPMLLLDFLKLDFSFPKILALTNIAKKIWTSLSRYLSQFQKMDHSLGTSLSLSPQTSITKGLIWNFITSINSAKTILLPLELLDQIESCLQLYSFRINSNSAGNNTNKK